MPAYILLDVDVTDPDKYAEYAQQAPTTLAAYGGKYLVRGGAAESLEGGWQPKRLVVLEFPDLERATSWWTSEEYRAPKAMREAAAKSRTVIVQGVASH
jgi:uncharacterized protein (DUF1330 family)